MNTPTPTPTQRSTHQPERLFIWLGLVFGLLFIALTPPFQVPDEPNHFYRAYQISQGQLFAERRIDDAGGLLPSSLVQTVSTLSADIPFHPEARADLAAIRAAFSVPLRPQERVFVSFPNTAIYGFIPYLPQVIGMVVGRLLGLSPLGLLYAGRLTNLLVALALTGWAIHLSPVLKRTFLLIGLMPMTLYLLASVSPDAFAIGATFLFTAACLDLALRADSRLTNRRTAGLTALGMLMAASKGAYASLLILLVPPHKAGSRMRYGLLVAALLATSAAFAAFFGRITAETYVVFHGGSYPSFAAAQQFILDHPWDYAIRLLGNLYRYTPFYLHSFVGILGWLDTPLPPSFAALYLLALVGVTLSDPTNLRLTRGQIAWVLAIIGVVTILILTSQFMLWTNMGAGSIARGQGRYFIPAGPLLFLPLLNLARGGRWRMRAADVISVALPVSGGLLAMLFVVLRYYGR